MISRESLGKGLGMIVGLGVCAGLLGYGVTKEVEVGGLSGSVLMKENGKPLPNALVTLEPIYYGEDVDTPVRIHRAETDKDGKFSLRNVRSADYLLTVTGDAHEMSRVRVKVKQGKPLEATYRLPPIAPYLDLYASQHAFTPDEVPKFQVKGFTHKGGDLSFTSYKLDMGSVLAQGSLYRALSPLARADYRTGKVTDPASVGTVHESWTQVPERDLEGVFVESIEGKKLEEGLYWVQAKCGGMSTGTWLMITRIALVTKRYGGDALAFVTDLQSGQPIEGATISSGGAELGKTRADGELRTMTSGRTIVATHGKSQALVETYEGSGDDEPNRVVMYTDRPIYRPGDTVEFKGIVRTLQGLDYTVPAPAPVAVELRDESDQPLATTRLTTNSMGTYAGNFTVSKELGPGYYSIVSTYGGEEYREGLSVAAYRKPTYTIEVSPELPSYIRGDRVRMKVKTEYYFGGPVPNAKVDAYVYRSEFFDPSVYGEEYIEGYGGGGGGDYVDEISGVRTDANGEAWIEFDTADESKETAESDFVYSVSVSVADEGGKYFEGEGSVKVLRGEFSLGMDAESWVVTPGSPFTVIVRGGKPDGTVANGVSVDVVSGVQFWNGEDMAFFKPEKQTVQLNDRGMATLQLTPSRAGSYAVKATATDRRGNVIGSSLYVWATGDVDANAFEPTKLELTLDHTKYKVGDTAKGVIRTGSPGGYALVTAEADKLYESRVVYLDKPATTFELPIAKQHSPNVFVSVAYVREKQFNQTEERLVVDDRQRRLKVTIEPDKPNYKPGDIAIYSVTTASEDGTPTSAEVSVGVVDESIYALAEDNTDLLAELYPQRYNRVDTQYSFPDLYLDGDKAPTSIQVRRKFKDTAFWAPAVTTDPTGKATVSVQLPDNLTTWRATAYGITSRTEVGSAVSKVMANKELMVRLETPAFLVGQDKQRIAAVVTNNTGGTAEVNVEFTAQQITLEGQALHKLTLEKGETRSVELMASPQRAGEAVFTAKAWIDGGANDGVESRVPVLAHGRTIRERYAGAVDGSGTVTLTKRGNADLNVGRLRVTVAPSLAPSLVQALDVLIDFPYGCTEQTMSRFLPAVTISKAMQSSGFGALKRASEIPSIVADGVTRLGRMQHSSGAWGWWEYDEDDAFMTAYVLDGLARAKAAGYRIDDYAFNRGIEWAKKRIALAIPPVQPATSRWEKEYFEAERRREIVERSYLAQAVAAAGDKETVAKWFAAHPPKGSPLIAASAAISCQALGIDPTPALAALASQATVSGAVASWREEYWGVETTGRCLDALLRAKPDHPLVDKAARWLMEKRRGLIWWSTRDSSFALLSLARYVARTKELGQTGQIQVKLNGTVIGTVEAVAGSGQIDVPVSGLNSGENKLEFLGLGVKRMYYAAELHQVDVSTDLQPAPVEGLNVERRYFKMASQRLEDGTMKFAPGKEPVASARPGDFVQVQITLRTDRPREYVLIEDPLPAGCVVSEREEVGSQDDWSFWWDKIQIFDDRVALFAGLVPSGEHVVTYTLRIENPGVSHALPTSVSGMYDPDAVASSGGGKLEVGSR